jgi:hypothetical protein
MIKKKLKHCIIIFNYSHYNKFDEDNIQKLQYERAVLVNPLIFSNGKPTYKLDPVEVKIFLNKDFTQ